MNQWNWRRWLILSVFGCVLFVGMGLTLLPQGDAVAQEATVAECSDLEPVTRIQTNNWARLSEEDLMERSSLVVYGRLTGVSDPFRVESDYGESAFIDYTLQIYETLRGTPQGQEILVRVEDWSADGVEIHPDPTGWLTVGEEYLLFLTVPGGGVFDTPDDYYYILGGPSGIFRTRASLGMPILSGRAEALFTQVLFGIELRLTELRRTIAEVNATIAPPDEDDFRQMGIDAILGNIESGVLFPDTDLLEEAQNRPSRPARIIEE